MTENEIRFATHDLDQMALLICQNIRDRGKDFAEVLEKLCSNGPSEHPEFAKAIDAIDQAVMWANAAVARAEARRGN